MANRNQVKRGYVLVPEGDGLKPDDVSGPAPSCTEGATTDQDGQERVQSKPGDDSDESAAAPLASFSLLYESKDGRLCTFEDSDGHLTSVDSQHML